MIIWIRTLCLLLICLVPQLSFAATSAADIDELLSGSFFNVTAYDPTRRFLEMLFGTVGPVLHGTSGMFLGIVFKVFNFGILAVATLFLAYGTAKTLLTTAHEGSFMGEDSKSTFLIIRTVTGMGLMTPSFITGYSMIQVFIMWVVLQGVGFANGAWSAVLDYLEEGGSIMATPAIPTHDYIDLAGTIELMQVCMYTHQEIETKKMGGTVAGDAASFPAFQYQSTNDSFYFPSARGNKDAGCGRISWVYKDPSRNDIMKSAIELMITGIAPAAREVASQYSAAPDDLMNIRKSAIDMTRSRVAGAAADFINVTLPLRATSRMDTKLIDNYIKNMSTQTLIGTIVTGAVAGQSPYDALVHSFFEMMRKQGWIYAGAFYYTLGQVQGSMFTADNLQVNVIAGPEGFEKVSGYGRYVVFYNNLSSPLPEAADTIPPELLGYYALATSAINDVQTTVSTQGAEADAIRVSVDANDHMVSSMVGPIVRNQNKSLSGYQDNVTDPIMLLQGIGYQMMLIAFIAWIIVTLIVFGITAGASIFSSINPAGFGVITMVNFFVPSFMGLVASIYSQGVTLAVYIPFVPFFIFSFAAIGWFGSVIEAMIAGPLIALGMTHPDGHHEMLGESQQAVMLLLGVFLRPILLVIGLISGMLISRIGLQYVNQGFLTMMATGSAKTPIPIMTFLASYFMYIGVIIAVIHTCYNLIYEIPDKVMRWVGMAGESAAGSVQGALQGAKSGAEEGGAVMGQTMGRMTKGAETGAAEGGKKLGQWIKDKKEKASAKAKTESGDEVEAADEAGVEGGAAPPGAWRRASPKVAGNIPQTGSNTSSNSGSDTSSNNSSDTSDSDDSI